MKLKAFIRRLLLPIARFKTYANPEAVGGWLGWYEIVGQCIAFKDIDGHITTRF